MNKKEQCLNNDTIAYYYGLGGVEIKHIEYGIEDYVYCVSGVFGSPKIHRYHKLKVYNTEKGSYIKLHDYKIPRDESIRV